MRNAQPSFHQKYVWQQTRPNFLHACTFATNSGKHIAEWITFHRLMGIGSFTIYENAASVETERLDIVLGDYIKDNVVKLIRWPDQAKMDSTLSFSNELQSVLDLCTNQNSQSECYQAAALHCVETHNNFDWVVVLDSQDFIFPEPNEQQDGHLRTLENIVTVLFFIIVFLFTPSNPLANCTQEYFINCSSIVVPAYGFNNVSIGTESLVIEKYLTRYLCLLFQLFNLTF